MIPWFGQELDEIPASYERVEPPPDKTLVFRVLGYRLGAKIVHVKPTYSPREKIAIGLTVQRLDRPEPVREWLLVGPQPVAVLEPLLATPATSGGLFSLQIVGQRPFQHWVIGYQPDQEG